MKTAILTSPEMAPAISVHSDAAHAITIGLVQGDPQSLKTVQAMLEHLLGTPAANTASIVAMGLSIMAGLTVLACRLNGRKTAMLILACLGSYGLAILSAIQAVASMRH